MSSGAGLVAPLVFASSVKCSLSCVDVFVVVAMAAFVTFVAAVLVVVADLLNSIFEQLTAAHSENILRREKSCGQGNTNWDYLGP